MQELMTLVDADLDAVLNDERPVLLLLSDGSGLRGDFSTAFKQAVGEHDDMVFAQIDPTVNPQAKARFEVGSKPLLIGWYQGKEIVRRTRPWGSDVPLSIEMLQAEVEVQNPTSEEEEEIVDNQSEAVVNDKPFIVTDDTFQTEVIDYSQDAPVLVDFWAEWCGPCRMVSPILEKLAEEFAGQIRIAKVNVDENQGVAQTFRVMSIPNIMAIKNRTIVFNQPGALQEANFRDLIQQLINLEVPDPELEEEQTPAD
jgi:thioredoxin